MPILLGEGIRVFDHPGPGEIALERTSVSDAPGVTHLRYRVRHNLARATPTAHGKQYTR